jgi:hypothetical protein
MEPSSLPVPPNELIASIATLRQFPTDATAMLTYFTEACPLIRTEPNVHTHNGGQLISGLGDCIATLDFELENFVKRFSLPPIKSKVKPHIESRTDTV